MLEHDESNDDTSILLYNKDELLEKGKKRMRRELELKQARVA
ncbi:hypothetical protein ACO22_06884 [Paracoccidioides brasiliensis]|uniref:Uncharacterized protein n=1 Tax=Paracoccidioides brasiliensis TaxID=121759 RepID=A0A1D2J6B9_PARBR|nr:hypothetical protein ACO22_06884 [Paracoccidioides brasiliensis]